MKKIIISTISIVVSSLVFNACSTASPSSRDAKYASYTYFKKATSLENVHQTIKEIGENNGWRVTDFQENALIAEKEKNGSMKAVTIHFTKDSFSISPKDSELQEAIEKSLNK